jgi:hypothetical protein
VASLFARPEPIQFLFVGHIKGIMYGNSPHSKDDLKESIRNIMFSVSPAELQHRMNNVIARCDAPASQRNPFTAPSLNTVSKSNILTAVH